jgi:acetyl-CoA carboxylase carboxyltransferase component
MSNLKTLDSKTGEILSASSKIRSFIGSVFDKDSFVETDVFMSGSILPEGVSAPGEGAVTGYASLKGQSVYLFAQNKEVLSGSFSKAQADKIIKVVNMAVRSGAPLIAVIDSNGARIGEGVKVLEAYSAVVNAITVASMDIPVISVIKGNCVGLMSAIPALSDYVFASSEAIISLASPSVVYAKSGSIGKTSDLLGSQASMVSGLINDTYKTETELSNKIGKIVTVLSGEKPVTNDDPNRQAPSLDKGVSASTIITALLDKAEYNEYSPLFAPEMKCGFGSINDVVCGIAISDAGVSENLTKAGIKKLTAFIELLDKFDIPFISLVDNAGVQASIDNEKSGISIEYAKLLQTLNVSGISKLAVIYGKCIGTAYPALAAKSSGYDYVLALSTASITPVDPEVAVNVMYTDELKKAKDPAVAREKLIKTYSDMQGDPTIAASDGYIDNVIAPSLVRPYVASALIMLLGL